MHIDVVGNLSLDTLYRVGSLPGINEVSLIRNAQQYFGGWAGNIAAVTQYLGLQTSLFAVAGADFVESGYKAHLSQLGVDLDGVMVIKEQKNAHFFQFKDSRNNSFAFFESNVEQEHYDGLLRRMYSFPMHDLVCLAKFGSNEATNYFLKGVLENRNTSLVVAMGHIHNQGGKQVLMRILSSAKYIFMNQTETRSFLSILRLKRMQVVFSLPGVLLEAIIITKGYLGSIIYTSAPSKYIQIPGVTPDRLVNTLGAGDAYIGAFLYGVAHGWGLQKCGEFASVFSSFNIEIEGSQSFPSREELEQRYFKTFRQNLWDKKSTI